MESPHSMPVTLLDIRVQTTCHIGSNIELERRVITVGNIIISRLRQKTRFDYRSLVLSAYKSVLR